MLHEKGLRLPKGFDVKQLRELTKDWLLDEQQRKYRWFGADYWEFVSNWQTAWTHKGPRRDLV